MPRQAETIRREINPVVRVLDASKGLVKFIASTASVDCSGEVVDQRGWQFNRFEKNAPVVDSHDYSTIEKQLGKVVDYAVVNGALELTVQFAIDVPENTLARKAFAMIAAGYLKACSVGFIALRAVTRFDSGDLWDETIKDLGLGDEEDSIQRIYLAMELLELSICLIPANPDCVAKAYKAGIIEDSDLLRFPQWRQTLKSAPAASRRSYSFGSQSQPSNDSLMSTTNNLLAALDRANKSFSSKTIDHLESARRGQSESELFRAAGQARLEMARYRRQCAHEVICHILDDDLNRRFLNGLLRYACKVSVIGGTSEDNTRRFMSGEEIKKSLTTAPGAIGATLLPIDVSKDIFDLVMINGAFRDLGYTPMSSMFTKFPQTTANPQAYWITPSNSGTTIPADASLTGSSLTPEANSLGIILPVSYELLQDEKVDLGYYLLSRFSQAIAGAIDYASLQGNGANDQTNGSQTGIFVDNTITSVAAAGGNTTINQLSHDDFMAAVAAVSAGALQRPCRWFISPVFIPQLMLLVDSQAHDFLLKTPGDSGDGEWYLCGFPVTWSAQAPATNAPGAKIAAFGHGPSYMVAVREILEVLLSDSTGFASNQKSFRAIARAFCQTRQANGLSTLALAAG